MSTAGPLPDESAELRQQIEAVMRDYAAMVESLKWSRRVRQGLFLAGVLAMGITLLMFYRLGRQFSDPKYVDTLSQTAEHRFAENSDRYLNEFQLLLNHSSPPLVEAFSAQVKKDLPTYLKAMDKERDQFTDEFPDHLSDKVGEHYQHLLDQHDAILKEEFPEIKDEQLLGRMMANLDVAVQKLVKRYYADKMHDQLVELFHTWDQFPAADPPQKGANSLEDRFVVSLLELLNYQWTHPGENFLLPKEAAPAIADTQPKPTKPAPKSEPRVSTNRNPT